jgi:hypothetical protein
LKKKITTALIASGLALTAFGGVASAHNAGPCNDSGEPGNSDYARHHIAPVAQAGSLGAGGHIPGTHHGFSVCDPSGS